MNGGDLFKSVLFTLIYIEGERNWLKDAESSNKGCLAGNGSADSLRTLLACGEQRVTFHSQVPLCVRSHIISLLLVTFSLNVEPRLLMRPPARVDKTVF